MRNRRIVFQSLFLLAVMAGSVQAHFIWVMSEPAEHPTMAKVYLSEDAAPDDPDLLAHIAGVKAWVLGGRGEDPQEVTLKIEDDAFVAEIPEKLATQPVIAQYDFGVMSRGDAPFLLQYYAKSYPSALPGTWNAVNDAELLPLEVTPELQQDSLQLTVTWKGKPVDKAQVTVEGPGIKDKEQGETDEKGRFTCKLPEAGLYSIRARRVDETAGELNGKKYDLVKQYSTLALQYVPGNVTSQVEEWPDLAQGTTSFGAGITGDHLYVYGGHFGQAHHYSREGQSGEFSRLNLSEPGEWESLPGGPKRTGLAMVAHDGKLYRVGGFAAENNEDEDEKLVSKSDFARFDPQTGKWEDLAPLPEGRSSHDIAVLNDTLYVVGGWEMNKTGDDQEHDWLKTAWSCDLTQPKLEWKPVAAPPFERRAVSLAAHNGKIYVIGGMQTSGGPTTRVDIFDPASETWSIGPSILGGVMDGFGTASFAVDGDLYTTTMSGSIQKLSDDASHWEFAGQVAHPRFFHEMIPWNNSLVLVGGASMMVGKIVELERLPVGENESPSQKAALLK